VSDPVLVVHDLGKAYRTYAGEWRRVLSWVGVPAQATSEHWA
jgi:hypothetical protein